MNIQFLWELEEEIGSPHFAAGLAAAIAGDAAAGRAPFATDSVVVSDTIWTAAGHPSISYGLRGLMGFTIALETGAKDVHSGTTGGVARNPIGELAALLAAMYDARTGRGEDPRLLRGRSQDLRRREEGVRARRLLPQALRRRARASQPPPDARATSTRWRRSSRRRRSRCTASSAATPAPASRPSSPTAPRPSCRRAWCPIKSPAKVFKLIKAFVKKRLPDAVVAHEASLAPYLAPIGGPITRRRPRRCARPSARSQLSCARGARSAPC